LDQAISALEGLVSGPRAARVISIWRRYGPLQQNGSEFLELMAQSFSALCENAVKRCVELFICPVGSPRIV
jgi:hypothetical protein